MEISAATAAAWFVPLVVVLTVVGAGLITAAALAVAPGRRPSRSGSAPASEPAGATPRTLAWHRFGDDDLADFARFPPGSPAADRPAAPAVVEAPAVRAAASPAPSGHRMRAGAVLAVAGLTVLIGAAVVAAAGPRGGQPAPASRTGSEAPDRRGLTASLSFGGVVLEPRAVGLTVTYPQVDVTVGRDDGTATAHVRFPAYNCLAADVPTDAVAAGCVRTLDEYADLRSPALSVVREPGGVVEFSGRFPTYTRPNGSPPQSTGRVYELRVTVTPLGPTTGARVPATGVLVLAGHATETATETVTETATETVPADGVNVLRYVG